MKPAFPGWGGRVFARESIMSVALLWLWMAMDTLKPGAVDFALEWAARNNLTYLY
jgi:hypothetical protein